VKRAFDIAASLAALTVVAPLYFLVAFMVRHDSAGPILYRGERVGKDGRSFHILKFRTMIPDAERAGTTTAANDSRVTRVGAVLRKWKLDEMPQLLNVLKGDMSLVGPRPEVAEHTSAYTDEEREILSVRPGITDLSSIYFFRLNELLGSTDPHRVFVEQYRSVKNALRLEYVRSQSTWLDISILVATATTVLSGGRWVLRMSPHIRPIARKSS
jgi:lipopolysaccharide/colanic/teichoic acid biosynthesis glycosyltransferase